MTPVPDPEAPFVPPEKIVRTLDPALLAAATAVAHVAVPDGWRVQLGSYSGLIFIYAPNHDGAWSIFANLELGLWEARIAEAGGNRSASTLHTSPQDAVDAIVARHIAHTIGDYELAAAQ